MAGRTLRALKIGGRVIVGVLAFVGGAVVLAAITSRSLNLYRDRVVAEAKSPDGSHVARVLASEQAFDQQTLVTVERTDGGGKARTVLSYEVPFDIKLQLGWSDADTLRIALPCDPPSMQRQFYDDADPWRRIIIEYAVQDPTCRLKRGMM